MKARNFINMLKEQWSRNNFVCVGLDSEISKLPKDTYVQFKDENIEDLGGQLAFNCKIVDATCDLVCAYKPNYAFYADAGIKGLQALYYSVRYINRVAPDVPVILDSKNGDIGNTNEGYIRLAFEYLGVDAITVHNYLGYESLQPFIAQKEKGIIVLCRTSNPGAGEFQDRPVLVTEEESIELFTGLDGIVRREIPNGPIHIPLYQYVACRVVNFWNKNGNCLLVVGATGPEELREVRSLVGDMPILLPGIGAQGGDVEKTVLAGKDSRGRGMIINSSRGIIFASKSSDFAEAARGETMKLKNLINQYRNA